jgi:hypothetical protein
MGAEGWNLIPAWTEPPPLPFPHQAIKGGISAAYIRESEDISIHGMGEARCRL